MSSHSNQGYTVGTSGGAPPVATRKNWLSRNWKWLVPVVLIVGLGLPLALVGSVFAAMKNSDAAKESVLQAQRSPLVIQKLGAPITQGWLISGSINTSTTSGDADLAVPISGPKGQAKIYVSADKNSGVWKYRVMEVAIDGSNERINLLSSRRAEAELPTSPPRVSPAQPVAEPTAQPAPVASSTELPAVQQSGVIQTQETNKEGMVADLTECRRHEGVLTIKLRFRNTSNKKLDLELTENGYAGVEKFYITAGNKKFFILKDTEGIYLSSLSSNRLGVVVSLQPGQSMPWWAKYPAPSPEVTKIILITPVTTPFEDISITDN